MKQGKLFFLFCHLKKTVKCGEEMGLMVVPPERVVLITLHV